MTIQTLIDPPLRAIYLFYECFHRIQKSLQCLLPISESQGCQNFAHKFAQRFSLYIKKQFWLFLNFLYQILIHFQIFSLCYVQSKRFLKIHFILFTCIIVIDNLKIIQLINIINITSAQIPFLGRIFNLAYSKNKIRMLKLLHKYIINTYICQENFLNDIIQDYFQLIKSITFIIHKMQQENHGNSLIVQPTQNAASDGLLLEEKLDQTMIERAKKVKKQKAMSQIERKDDKLHNTHTNSYFQHSKTKMSLPKQFPPVQTIYQEAKQFISNFDTTIIKCKRFNQVKTYRKYEVIMKDMQIEIQKLKNQLQMQEQMKSPTKDYLNNILSKLVEYKQENTQLKKELEESKNIIALQENQIEKQKVAIHKLQNVLKGKIEKFPSIQTPTVNVEDGVKVFFSLKQNQLRQYNLPSSKLHNFLKKIYQQLWKMDLPKLLFAIDKWAEGVQQSNKPIDMWKIRYGVAKKFSLHYDGIEAQLTNKREQKSRNNSLFEIKSNRSNDNTQINEVSHWKTHNRKML